MKKKVKTYYFDKNSNFGDQLNIPILKSLFNIEPIHTNPNESELVCIGSLLEGFLHGSSDFKNFMKKILLPKVNIWGTGFISPENTRIIRPGNKEEIFSKKVEIHALRGKLTKKRVEKILNKKLSEVPVGDPGLLVSKLIDASQIEKQYKVGIVPHYIDASNPKVQLLYEKIGDSVIIDIMQPPIDFLKKIAACECIVSSAMHGLIAADGLSVPNRRMIFSDKIFGGDYKFNDYYSAFDLEHHEKIDFQVHPVEKFDVQEITRNYPIQKEKLLNIQESLMKSFPALSN